MIGRRLPHEFGPLRLWKNSERRLELVGSANFVAMVLDGRLCGMVGPHGQIGYEAVTEKGRTVRARRGTKLIGCNQFVGCNKLTRSYITLKFPEGFWFLILKTLWHTAESTLERA